MNDDMERGDGGGFRAGTLGLVLAGALALYVLLLGPAAYVYDSCPDAVQKGIAYIYTPLQWLDQQIPGQPFSWYVDLWT